MTGNSRTRRTKRRPVRDPWLIYDGLPVPIRAALQEGPCRFDAATLAFHYRRLRRAFGEAEAVKRTIEEISRWTEMEIQEGRPWKWPGRKAPSPHVAAGATMQTSGREVRP
jgi:hypothetical protein